MTNILIGIDIDGVLCDLYPTIAKKFNQKTGLDIHARDVVNYNMTTLWGVSRDFFNNVLSEIDYVKLPEVADASTYMQQLSFQHQLFLITHRVAKASIKVETETWLREHSIPYHLLAFRKEKLQLAKTLSLDLMVEDNPFQAEEFIKAEIPLILFDYPYNREIVERGDVFRVKSWEECYNKIKSIERELCLRASQEKA